MVIRSAKKNRLKPLLVGQAPSSETRGKPAFAGRSGARLARLLGMPVASALEPINLLKRFPGKADAKGDLFPIERARRAARRTRLGAGRTVLLAGGNVARAFGVTRFELFAWFELCGTLVAVVPHPSGISHWWNDPSNVRRARRCFRSIARAA